MALSPLVGKRFYPEPPLIQRLVKDYHRQIPQQLYAGKTVERLCQAHNRLARYLLLMLLHATGHRPVDDPFWDAALIDREEGWLFIQDKGESSGRLVVIPDGVKQQLTHYHHHIQRLAVMLHRHREGRDLAQAIRTLGVCDRPMMAHTARLKIPYLFQIKTDPLAITGFQHADIAALYTPYQLPANCGRHLLAEQLGHVPHLADAAAAQLGHRHYPYAFFGTRSDWSVREFDAALRPAIEAILMDQGFLLIPLRHDSKAVETFEHILPAIGPWGRVLGFFTRQQRAHEQRQHDQQTLQAFIHRCGEAHGLQLFQQQEPEVLKKELDQFLLASEPSQRGRLNVLYYELMRRFHRLLRRHPHDPLFLGGKAPLLFQPEREPWRLHTLYHYQQSRHYRQLWFHRVDGAQSGTHFWVEVACSLVWMGGWCDAQRLFSLLQQIQTTGLVRWNHQTAGCDLVQNSIPITRWLADPITLALLLTTPNRSQPALELSGFQHQLAHRLQEITGREVAATEAITTLCRWGEQFWSLLVPGSLRAYLKDRTQIASLPSATWLRLLSKRPLAPLDSPVDQTAPPLDRRSLSLPLRPNDHSHHLNLFLRGILQVFQEMADLLQQTPAQGYQQRPPSTLKLLELRFRYLLSQGTSQRFTHKASPIWPEHWWSWVTRRASLWPTDAPPPQIALLWLDYLIALSSGVISHHIRKPSSVHQYCTLLMRPLLAATMTLNWLELEGEELVEPFRLIIEQGRSEQNRRERFRELQRFYAYIAPLLFLEPLAWQEIAQFEREIPATAVSANMISPSEYQAILSRLLHEPSLTPLQHLQSTAALWLMTRAGLRISECRTLAVRSLQYTPDAIYVHIMSGAFGTPKSAAGHRQVAIVAPFSEAEQQVIRGLQQQAEQHADPLAALLSPPGQGRFAPSRYTIAASLMPVIHAVTGDRTLTPHHLRHSFANHHLLDFYSAQLVGLSDAEKGALIPPTSAPLLGWHAPHRPPFALFSLSMLLGHGDPHISWAAYYHVPEWIVHGLTLKELQRTSISAAQRARFLGLTSPEYALRSHRYPEWQEPARWCPLLLENNRVPLPAIALANQPPLLPKRVPEFLFSLEQMDHLLTLNPRLPEALPILAQQFQTSERAIASLIHLAQILQTQTGYSDYQIGARHWVIPPSHLHLPSSKQIKSRQRILRRLESTTLFPSSIPRLVEWWLRCYSPNQSGYRLREEQDVDGIPLWIKSLGHSFRDYVIDLPPNTTLSPAVTVKFQEWGLPCQIHRVKQPESATATHAVNRILLRYQRPHKELYLSDYNRILFLLTLQQRFSLWLASSSKGDELTSLELL